MNNKKILVILATGFEDTELIAALDVFNREELQYDLLSIEGKKVVRGHNIALIEPTVFNNDNLENYDALFLPGGVGHKLMLENNFVLQLIKTYHTKGKLISAICAAPSVLQKAGVLEDKNFTSYPGYAKSDKNTGNPIEIADNLITGRDFEATIDFAKEIAKKLKNNS